MKLPRGQCSLLFVTCVLAVSTVACDPPGKPKQEPPSSQDITDFRTLYGENCAGCHGVDGKNGPARPLNDALYLAVIPQAAMQQVIENGRPGTAMPAWALSQGGPLTPKQVTALVNGIESNWSKPAEFQGASLPPYSAADDAGDAGHGKQLFTKDCYMCHGPGAAVGPVTDPAVLETSSNQVLRTAIIEGRPDLGMPDYRSLNMGHALSNQDISDLVAHLISLRPAGPNESAHVNENQTGQGGSMTKGNEGSGNGPGSPRQQQKEGNKSTGSSSQGGVK